MNSQCNDNIDSGHSIGKINNIAYIQIAVYPIIMSMIQVNYTDITIMYH